MKREPLLSDEQIVQVGLGVFDRASVKKSRPLQHLYNAKYCGAAQVRDHYEAARAKDAELIQDLLDSLALLREVYQSATGYQSPVGDSAIAASEAHGFKPSQQ